jgi:acetyltransferase-like isoleucine patch superfamily enzyme
MEEAGMNRRILIAVAAGLALAAAAGVYAMRNHDNPGDAVAAGDAKSNTFKLANLSPFSSRVTVPAGTSMSVVLQTSLTTKSTNTGDLFSARVAAPVVVNGKVAVPEGAAIHGHVVLAEQPGKASGRGKLQLAYDRIEFGGHGYDVDSRSQVYESKSGTAKDVALIGGGAVLGGVVGGIVGGSVGKGAAIGAATGTGASLMTRGPQLELGAGTTLHFTLDRDIAVRPASSA